MSSIMPRMKEDETGPLFLQRLRYIDFCLFFLGSISRNALTQHFGISSAAATRDLAEYKREYPGNIIYNNKSKEYYPTEDFLPVYDHDVIEAFSLLSYQPLIGSISGSNFICEKPMRINDPDLFTLAKITRAVYQEKILNVSYYSLSNGLSEREFIPFAFVDTGLRWHVRGFDRKRQRFTDFVINRIRDVSLIEQSTIKLTEHMSADIQWNRIVEMQIVPHPELTHPETIMHEYDMLDGVLKINIRAAVAGYFLRRWNIDCSKHHEGRGAAYHLWLKNSPALYGVENIGLAPLYSDIDSS